MNWEEKMSALQAVSEITLRMRKPGDWYVDARMEIGEDGSGVLIGSYGNGTTPQEAIEDHWNIYAYLPWPKYCVASQFGKREHVRWNGFMWRTVPKEVTA